MEIPRPPRRRAWQAAFGVSLLAFASSLLALSFSIRSATGAGHSAQAASAGPPPPDVTLPQLASDGPLLYVGVAPPGLDPAKYAPATAGGPADIAFEPAPDGVAVRYWAPVASIAAGIDALTQSDVAALLAPGDGPLQPACPGHPAVARGPVTAAITPDAQGAQPFTSFPALLDAMAKPDGCLVALVPLDAVRPDVMAIAVDGVDLVRGRGDPTAWPYTERVAVRGLTPRGRGAAPALATSLVATLPRPTRVAVTGDILMSRCSLAQIRAAKDWGSPLRGPMADYLAGADLALGSFDGSIQDVNAPYGCVQVTNLSSPPEVLEALTLAGFDEMTVATNHVFDCGIAYCGTKAFLQTIDRLQAAGIKTVGGGRTLEEALAPAIFDIRGTRFGLLGFDDVAAMDLEATDTEPGTAPLDDDYREERRAGEPAFYRPAAELGLARFKERIARLRDQADVVIVQVQSGTEDTHTPSPRSIKALRAAVDAGATLVVGNQAHWVQAIEPGPNAFIAYALGNFVFDQVHTPEHTQGYVLEATFWGARLANVRLLPYQIVDRYRPVFAEGALRTKILRDVTTAWQKLAACTSAVTCPR